MINGLRVQAQPQPARAAGSRHVDRRDLLIIIALFFGTLALYVRTARFDCVNLDDGPYVYGNDHVRGGLSGENVIWALTTGWPAYWHPLTFLSLMFDAQCFGPKPGPMHIHNALLHAANSALLFLALLRLTGERWPSAWVAAMFAWHPLHVESVAWITERKDMISALFLILCVLSYLRYFRKRTKRSYLLVLVMLLFGLMSKPMLVTTPALLLLLDIWPLRRLEDPPVRSLTELKRVAIPLVAEKIPMVLVVIACAVVTIVVQRSIHSIGTDPLSDRVSNSVLSYGRYLWMMIVPKGLAVFYPLHTRVTNGGHIPLWQVGLSAAVLALLTLIAAVSYRRVPAVLIGWLWYLVALVPVIGLVQSGEQSHADRFTYIPLIGIFVAVAWSVAAWVRDRPVYRNAVVTLAIATVVAAVGMSWHQIGFWRDSYTLMQRAIDVVPNNFLAHRSIGECYDGRGDTARAEAEYYETLRIRPDSSALQHLATHALKAGREQEALEFFRRTVFADPTNGEVYNDYANLLAKQGRTDEAIEVYRAGIRRAPNVKELYHNYALLLAEQGKMSEAIQLWQQAVKLDPDYADAHANLGTALIMTGQTRQGLLELQTALALQPDRIDALKSRAWTLATHPSPLYQNGAQAELLARRAVELTHQTDPIALDTLAAAEARNGKFDDAAQTAQSAGELAQQQGNAALSAQIQQRVKLYRLHQPFTSGR